MFHSPMILSFSILVPTSLTPIAKILSLDRRKIIVMSAFSDIIIHCQCMWPRWNSTALSSIFSLYLWTYLNGVSVMVPGPVICLLLGVSPDYAQPITSQVTEVTCHVVGQAQPELAPSKMQNTNPDHRGLMSFLPGWLASYFKTQNTNINLVKSIGWRQKSTADCRGLLNLSFPIPWYRNVGTNATDMATISQRFRTYRDDLSMVPTAEFMVIMNSTNSHSSEERGHQLKTSST